MGIKNYLIEGGSGTGKTSVATELERRGYHVIHGDRVLAYVGDPEPYLDTRRLCQCRQFQRQWRERHLVEAAVIQIALVHPVQRQQPRQRRHGHDDAGRDFAARRRLPC